MKFSLTLIVLFTNGLASTKALVPQLDAEAQALTGLLQRRTKQLENALLPMYKSLPKNRQGNLTPQVARYALHRLFEQQHSWSVNGLRPARGTDAEADAFGQLPAPIVATGISLENLAAIAAILEERIDKELVTQVKSTFGAMAFSERGEISASALDRLVDRYMTIYISGMREYNLTNEELVDQTEYMRTSTQDWPTTVKWYQEAAHEAVMAKKPCGPDADDCSFDFKASTDVLKEVVKRYGDYNGHECDRLKSTLLKMEDRKTGRVSLADFYKEGMSGTWEFNEKAEYLRDLGTLDESVPGQPRVIVANYVNSWVNCLTSSSLYSVCCRSACEDLMGHIERQVESPAASPEMLLQLVRSFKSNSVAVPHSISELSQTRLHKIAAKHDGKVPLHGRLFAQWLHHVIPQSCPFPHAAGATNPLTPDEWMKEKGHSAIKATKEEMIQAVNSVAVGVSGVVRSSGNVVDDEDQDGERSVPWSDDEELLVIHIPATAAPEVRFHYLDIVVMGMEVVVSMVVVFAILRGVRSLRRTKAANMHAFEKVVI